MLILEFLYSQIDLSHFQQSKHRERKDQQGKTDHASTSLRLAGRSDKPGDVKSLGNHRGRENPVSLQPVVGFYVNELKTVQISQEPLADLTAAPGDGNSQ